MRARWADFMADQEWSATKRRTRELGIGPVVGDIEERTLLLTDYSPQRRLGRAGSSKRTARAG